MYWEIMKRAGSCSFSSALQTSIVPLAPQGWTAGTITRGNEQSHRWSRPQRRHQSRASALRTCSSHSHSEGENGLSLAPGFAPAQCALTDCAYGPSRSLCLATITVPRHPFTFTHPAAEERETREAAATAERAAWRSISIPDE